MPPPHAMLVRSCVTFEVAAAHVEPSVDSRISPPEPTAMNIDPDHAMLASPFRGLIARNGGAYVQVKPSGDV
jgi:hypothetical protein